jgi:hypothetical protein
MSMTKFLLATMLAVSGAWASSCTSTGTGNWNVAGTWANCAGGVPGNGDTASLGDGHTVTIPAGYQAIVGLSDAGGSSGTAAVKCAAVNGTGVLTINGTLTFRGNVEECATWQANAGAIIEHDSTLSAAPATTHYRWIVGTRLFPDNVVFTIRGVSGNRVNIRNAPGTTTGVFYGFTVNTLADAGSGQIDFEYVTITSCGEPNSSYCSYSQPHNGSAYVYRCDHCLITNSQFLKSAAYEVGHVVRITNSTFTSPTSGDGNVLFLNFGATGNILVDTVFTNGILSLVGQGGISAVNVHVRNVVVQANLYPTPIYLGGAAFRVAEFDLVMRVTDDAASLASVTQPAYIPGGNLTRIMGLINSTLDPHFFYGPSGDGVTADSVDGGYAESLGGGNNTDGDLFLGTPQLTTTFKNIVSVCNTTSGYSPGTFANVNTVNSNHIVVLQNTICGKEPPSAQGVGFSYETWNGAAGLLSSAKNNIVYCATNTNCYLIKQGPGTTPVNGVYNGVDYNWKWNVSAGPYYGSNAFYTSPSPPGTHDSAGDPQFVQQRHFLDWGRSLDGTITTWTQIVAQMAKMNDDAGFDSRFTILNAYNWLRDGYRPQNAAVMTAGDTGGRVGALDAPTAPSGTSTGSSSSSFRGAAQLGGLRESQAVQLPITSPNVTATQALISYSAPDSSACTVEISESPTYGPLVHDVNPALFPGSNLDSRAESYSVGATRVFVAGKRRAERGLDGHWYSRALQTNTRHYYRRTCGADVKTGTFTTANIALGNTYNEPLPADPNVASRPYHTQAGSYAWPEFTRWNQADSTAKLESVIDPQTGVLLKRLALPQEEPVYYSGNERAFNIAVGSAWTMPANILVDDGNSATYSGAGSDWLYIGDDWAIEGYKVGSDYVTVALKAWCSAGACSGEDAKIEACFSMNQVNCWPTNATAKIQEAALGTTANPSTFVTLGTTVPLMDSWTPSGYAPLTALDVRGMSGTADVSAGGVVTWVSGGNNNGFATLGQFNPNWTTGTRITIGASVCTLTGPATVIRLTVTPASCSPALSVPVSGAAWSAASFGFLIRKKTSSTDQINLQYSKYKSGTSLGIDWNASGSANIASSALTKNTVTGGLGYHVILPIGQPMLYWVDHATGTANHLGQISTGLGSPCNISRSLVGTTPTAPEHFYCSAYDGGTPAKMIVYSCELTSTNVTGNQSTTCSAINPSVDLHVLIEAFTASDTPAFDHTQFGCYIIGSQGAKLIFECRRGAAADAIAWSVVFDPLKVGSAAGCIGGGSPGCVVGAMSTWAHAPVRWCVNHTTFLSGVTDLVWIAGKYGDFRNIPGDGPWISTVTAGTLGSTPSIAAGTGACPAGSLGCDQVTVDGEPCDTTPQPGEAAASACPKNPAWAFLQNAIVGDIFGIDGGEKLRLVAKAGNSWTLQRGYDHLGIQAHSNLDLKAWCSSMDFTHGSSNLSWTWDHAKDPHGLNAGGTTLLVAWDYDHPNPRTDVTLGGDPTYDTGCTVYPCYAIRAGTGSIGDPPNRHVALAPAFAGATGTAFNIERAQDHPGWLQENATAAEKSWFVDGRPLTPAGDNNDIATLVSGQLYKTTSTTSDGDNMTLIGGAAAVLGGLNRKLQPTWAYCGTQPLIDMSSSATGNVIGTTSTDAYRYCIARRAGECRAGSAQGDIYVNCPNQVPRSGGTYGCSVQDQNLYTDICISNSSAYLNSIAQMGFAQDDFTGALGRSLTKALGRYKIIDNYFSAQALADASWLMFRSMFNGGAFTNILLAKVPPFPATDAVVRSTFVPVPIVLTPPGGVNNAIIQFGYAENGPSGSFYCTSRQEKCLATASTIPAIPFLFPSDGAGGVETGISGVPCSTGCTVTLPALSQHMIYYQIKYRNVSNQTVATGQLEVIAVP